VEALQQDHVDHALHPGWRPHFHPTTAASAPANGAAGVADCAGHFFSPEPNSPPVVPLDDEDSDHDDVSNYYLCFPRQTSHLFLIDLALTWLCLLQARP
jgi:hypothetical protein